MPLYEYECKQCRQRLEKIQSFSAPPETICPKCGGQLERVISAPAIQFKGAGWYVNDYAKSGGKKAPSDDSASKSDGKSGGKVDVSASASDGKSDSSSKSAASTSDSSSASSNSVPASSNASSKSSSDTKSSSTKNAD